ncbi:MAG: TonB-dependent receptor plug domain-containing protein, partial [Opitutales bacterium]
DTSGVQELPPTYVDAYRFDAIENENLGSTTVITAEELEQRQPESAFDALRLAPGVNLRRNGGRGAQSTVAIRGLAGEQTLIMVDGVPVRNPASIGQVNLDFLPAHDIEQIEVLRGAQSVRHGADAMAGVINIVTKKDAEPGVQGYLDVSGGSDQTRQAQAGMSGRSGPWNFRADYNYLETDGFSRLSPRDAEEDGFENKQVSLHAGRELGDRGDVRGFYQRREIHTEFDSFPPPNYDPNPDDPLPNTEEDTDLLQLHANYQVIPEFWETRPEISWSQIDRTTVDRDGGAELDSESFNVDWENAFQVREGTRLIGGAEYEHQDAESVGEFEETTETQSLYGLIRQRLFERFTLEGGLRYDDNDRYGSETTYRVAAAWENDATGTLLHSSYGTSFRAPRLADQFSAFGGLAVPNPDLGPEEGESFDAGIKQSFMDERVTAGTTYFYNDIEDQIAYDFDPSTFTGTFVNLDSVRTQGFETTVDFVITEQVSLHLNHTWTETLDRDTGEELARIPEHEAAAILNVALMDEKLNLNLRGRYIGSRFDQSGGVDERGGYAVWDASASYAINDRFRVYGSVENIFDRDYEEIDLYATQDLSAFVGLRYSWGGDQ